jgi:hypothetical protein
VDGVVGVVGAVEPSLPSPPLPSCPGQSSAAVGSLEAVKAPRGSLLLEAAGTFEPEELVPVGVVLLPAIATVAQRAAAATTTTSAHQGLVRRRFVCSVCMWFSFLVGVRGGG